MTIENIFVPLLSLFFSLCAIVISATSKKTLAKEVKIKYKGDAKGMKLKRIQKGDCIDLYVNKPVSYKKGDTVVVDFGVAMELPKGYEAHIYPRSSTYEKTGLLLTNSVGIIDNAFCGDDDWWGGKFYATRDGELNIGDRVAQFRLCESMPMVVFNEVYKLGNKNRGGYGTTGR